MNPQHVEQIAAAVAGLCDALAEITGRFTVAVVAAALVFSAAQLRTGTPNAAEAVNSAGWVAVATAVAYLSFIVARLLLAEQGEPAPEAVTA